MHSEYSHIVYLIVDDEESADKDRGLWNASNDYIAMTRIHFFNAINIKNSLFTIRFYMKNENPINRKNDIVDSVFIRFSTKKT